MANSGYKNIHCRTKNGHKYWEYRKQTKKYTLKKSDKDKIWILCIKFAVLILLKSKKYYK